MSDPGRTTAGPTDDERWLEECLAEVLSQSEGGGEPDVEALCAERPHLLADLRAALGLLPVLSPLPPRPAAEPEALLAGRYRLRRPLGRGAAGVVFAAFDEQLHREVAVKLLHADTFGGADAAARFQREARVLAQQSHPHVVAVFDHGTTAAGNQFLVTELLVGQSLQAILVAAQAAMTAGPSAAAFRSAPWLTPLLPRAALDASYLRQVVRWIAQLGSGLVAAHAAGIYHRDVKPSNAFVRADGTAVLLDFGIAVRAGDPALTLSHSIVGTPCYMAPEQAEGRVEPGPALDIYGLCATLYHLLTLQPPHAGDLATVLHMLRSGDPVPASALHRGLPRDLQAILDKGLERRPQSRYATMAELVDDLQAFLDHRPVSVRPLRAVQRTWRHVRRQPARSLAVGLGIAVVLSLCIGVPALAALGASRTATERADLLARLPADLAIEGWPEQRLLVPRAEQQHVLAELDRLVALDGSDPSVRLLRAALWLDAGDHAAAARDLEVLAAAGGSDYMREVARRFARANAARKGVDAVDLANLPTPATPADCFVAGFHALRARDSDTADELLGRAGDFPPARDLRLLTMLGKKRPDPEAIVAEAGRLEGLYGRPTARTRHALGAAMLMLRRWQKAIPYCESALQLRPGRHGPWNNLGLAHLRLGNLEAARRCYEQAVAIRPWFPNSLSGLCQTLRSTGDFAAARARAQDIADVCWREHELGNVDVAEALAARLLGQRERQRELATGAQQHFEAAAAAVNDTRNPRASALPACVAYASALATDDVAAALPRFLDLMRSEPRNGQNLANLVDLLDGQDVDARTRDQLRLLLLDIAVDAAPDDPVIRNTCDELRQRLRLK